MQKPLPFVVRMHYLSLFHINLNTFPAGLLTQKVHVGEHLFKLALLEVVIVPVNDHLTIDALKVELERVHYLYVSAALSANEGAENVVGGCTALRLCPRPVLGDVHDD